MIANDIKPGNVIKLKGKLWVVLKTSHTQPGKGGAFVQAEMKEIKEGTKLNERFRSTEKIDKAHLDEKKYQFLYADGEDLHLMDNDTYEQLHMDKKLAGEPGRFLQDGMTVKVVSHEGTPISIELPEEAEFVVAEAEAVVKGQTAASSNKPATLENGARIMVPPFVEVGNKVVIKTAEGEYVKRA